MKIGMKMTMISVHSSGQPSRKMMTCARIMNWIGVRSSDSTQCSMISWPPSSANAAEKIDEPTNSQHTIALVLAVRNDRLLDDARPSSLAVVVQTDTPSRVARRRARSVRASAR